MSDGGTPSDSQGRDSFICFENFRFRNLSLATSYLHVHQLNFLCREKQVAEYFCVVYVDHSFLPEILLGQHTCENCAQNAC